MRRAPENTFLPIASLRLSHSLADFGKNRCFDCDLKLPLIISFECTVHNHGQLVAIAAEEAVAHRARRRPNELVEERRVAVEKLNAERA